LIRAVKCDQARFGAAVILFSREMLGCFRKGPQRQRARFFLIGIKPEMSFPNRRRDQVSAGLQRG
jgi:hypothetical protein